MAKENDYERIARELAEAGTSTLNLGPYADLVFTVRDSEHTQGKKQLHTELITGEYHKATLKLTSCPVLQPDQPWAIGVYHAVIEVWDVLHEAIARFQGSQKVLETAVPDEMKEN